ncbi:hypothetical protein [Roseococcus pinisoli]|uniref:Uncharacterized protein n=1 Tax=Roseococcus pinisoli TaxID=2835040 RepID=A0ABS5QGD6_9PROT|nr:hypothetical protein [Roseococcus pinisoli]MBS7812396.1 hypothetical protein [Roseococcus pinisoli]
MQTLTKKSIPPIDTGLPKSLQPKEPTNRFGWNDDDVELLDEEVEPDTKPKA